jgi:hypothetical protein
MLGDVIGFVAAAHLYSEKTRKPVEVYFQESRKDILKYFDGVVWVPKEPGMVDCGGDPTLDQWFQETPKMNGVSRFYRFMDPSMTPTKSFDVHFNRKREYQTEKIIGLITHSNTQGDIDDQTLETMLSDARKAYPEHKICLIGNKDNKKIPEGVEDWRQEKGDIDWIISTIEKCSLLITPQSGPCFIAAGFRIPMWIYRSKERFWDQVLNYEEFLAIKWYDRPKQQKELHFLDYPVHVMGCLGVGDIFCSLNAMENLGIERNKKIDIWVDQKQHYQRVFDIFNSLELNHINLHFGDLNSIGKKYTIFQAWGMDVSWVKGWPKGWGLNRFGSENMVKFKKESVNYLLGTRVGVSFTVNCNPKKNPSRETIIKVIQSKLDEFGEVVYYGYRKETDSFIKQHFGGDIEYCPFDLKETIKSISGCSQFVGADSGMAWIAAFLRIPTTILVGKDFGALPKTFGDIPWVEIKGEE